ncbi:hypothetical protein KGMB02408_37590 [Bacteroides faecalis]|uniref:MACPF protein D2 domain-containing protein n=1 Tax=Bacteroides faecalis TaxID=2447885 RepID=A0A401LZE4_9BACE|nr:hypothetical protein [Bacteroides faecalis]GCB36755.1 hypothetical protein KGMB02408_37000 [Bacteroides faecalis]GCB36814.1 hypothetical protein KGMB02408_37590 [Bacteroides faecalis]
MGGIQDETGVVNTTMALKDININLQSWRKSLNDSKNHTVIDLIEEGLYPMSDFVLERNFQRRFDDTSKEILLPVTRLYTPSITIARVLTKTSASGESLYDVAAVLTTRQGDQIVLSKSNATDAELRQNEDDNVFILKSATKPLNVLIAFTRPLITEFADNLNLKHPLLPTISPYPTM